MSAVPAVIPVGDGDVQVINKQRTMASLPSTRVKRSSRVSGDGCRHQPFAKISPAAQDIRLALINEIGENWEIKDQKWPQVIRPVKKISKNSVIRILPRNMSTKLLEGLCKLSSMTRGEATRAQKLLLAVGKARVASTRMPTSVQIKDIDTAIRKVREHGVSESATPVQQQGESVGITPTTTAAKIASTTQTYQQLVAGGSTIMSLTTSADVAWTGEHAVAFKNLYLMMQKEAMAAQKQSITVTLAL